MVIVSEGSLLDWNEIRQQLCNLQQKSLDELMKIYNKFKDIKNDPFKWGDEIEFSLVKFDHENKKVYLLLKSEKFFDYIDNLLKENNLNNNELKQVEFHNEYTSYIIETIPGEPINDDINSFNNIQSNMNLRRKIIQNFLDKNEFVLSLTSFPLLGCKQFTYPNHLPAEIKTKYDSLFYSNNIIMDRALFKSATFNKIDRKQSLPQIYVPIYKDINTPNEFRLDEEIRNEQIFMDHDGFGMGCCCIQVTFQAESIKQACYLYDQLTPIAPIVIALSASSPIWRGYLSDIDCRWNVLKQAFDDRTKEELGLEPLKLNKKILKRSRFDTTELYLSEQGSKYNNFEFDKDENVYNTLIDQGMDHLLANHFANIFSRDPYAVPKDNLINQDSHFTGNFDMLNCTNWKLLRFKPPPIKSEESNKIGWRVEFRPTELQLTDFQNASFATFIILLTKAIIKLNLNFLIDITKVDENMKKAQLRNACLNEKFQFRVNCENNFDEAEVLELTINEIINGNDKFKGLVPLIKEYLKTIENEINSETNDKLNQYLSLFEQRANGKLKTPASWIRKFVDSHPKYEHDSRINDEIAYDLIWNIQQISSGQLECPDLI
jgi:glutamate--cysteine ligase catalytic subunit